MRENSQTHIFLFLVTSNLAFSVLLRNTAIHVTKHSSVTSLNVIPVSLRHCSSSSLKGGNSFDGEHIRRLCWDDGCAAIVARGSRLTDGIFISQERNMADPKGAKAAAPADSPGT
jgi:hypothetical protein